jgi:hypothetical protein
MIYNTPTKGDDGLYAVKALKDDTRKYLIQVNGVHVHDVSGDVTFDLVSDANVTKVTSIDAGNLVAARENCSEWFGKKVSESVIETAYTPSVNGTLMSCDRIETTKVFNAQKEYTDQDIQVGKTCDVILEFAGLWFAKKAFGSSWNIVQVKLHDEPVVADAYPDEYAFVDEAEE